LDISKFFIGYLCVSMNGIDFENRKGSNLGDPKFGKDAVNLQTLQRYVAVISGNTVSAVVSGITAGNNIAISGTTSAITISLNPTITVNSINSGIMLSAGTNLYNIFSTTDNNDLTRVRNGINTFTGGTVNGPSVNITGLSINNLTVSGDTSLSATTISSLSASTIFSGSTNLYSIFQQIGGGSQTAVQPGTNITTAGTISTPIISTVDSPAFNNLSTSGTSIFSGNSTNEIFVIRNPDVYPSGQDSFQVWDGTNAKQIFIDSSNQIGFTAGTNGPLYFGTFANPSAGLGGFSSPNQVINCYSVNTIRMGVGGSGSYFATTEPKALFEARGKTDEIQLIVQKNNSQTENIIEVRDSSEVPLLIVDATGKLTASTATIVGLSATTLSGGTARLAENVGTVIYSAGTDLYNIFSVISSGISSFFSTQILSASNITTITHNLGTKFITVNLWNSSGDLTEATINRTGTTSVNITVATTDTYDIVIHG